MVAAVVAVSCTMVASAIDLNSQRGTAAFSFVLTRVNPTVAITASASTGSVGVPISFMVTPALTPLQPMTDVTVDFGDDGTRSLGVISGAATGLTIESVVITSITNTPSTV